MEQKARRRKLPQTRTKDPFSTQSGLRSWEHVEHDLSTIKPLGFATNTEHTTMEGPHTPAAAADDPNFHSEKRDATVPSQTAIVKQAESGIPVEEESDTTVVIYTDSDDTDTVALILETQDTMTVSLDPTNPDRHR